MKLTKKAIEQQTPGAIAKLLKVGKAEIKKMVEFKFVWMVVVKGKSATFVSKKKIEAIISIVNLVAESEQSKQILHSVLRGDYRTTLQLGKLIKIHTATIAAWLFNTDKACQPLGMNLKEVFCTYFGYRTSVLGGWSKAA